MVADDPVIPAPSKISDLRVRTISAIIMVAIAGIALWFGGYVWIGFVLLVASGLLWEWKGLVQSITTSALVQLALFAAGLLYVAVAVAALIFLRFEFPIDVMLMILSGVIATDIGAYFTGRTVGGPKIAPSISPSKTWSGLLGGMIFASLALFPQLDRFWICWFCGPSLIWAGALRSAFLGGALIAIIAQAGDFFESWMKRRAGVKDSGNLIPGHGGLFDRLDGLLAVLFVLGVLSGTERFL